MKIIQFCPHLWTDPRFKFGQFSNPDLKLRRAAIDLAKRTTDIAQYMEAEIMVYWPAEDGYDYPFQADHRKRLGDLVEGLVEWADYNPEQKIVVEYKAFEPRTHIMLPAIGHCMTVISEINRPNLNAMGLVSKMNYSVVPRCLYTWPEVAWVGLTEEQAEAQGIEVGIGEVPTAINLYAMILDETAGVIKMIADRKYGQILGVHIMAPGAVDLINVASVAMLSEATVDELMRLIPMHPALGEAVVDAAMDVEKRSLHLRFPSA